MIKIDFKKDKIVINGHSGYGELGTDIVCASVSSIAITTVNSILKIDNEALKYINKDGYLEIEVLKHNEVIDKLLENMLELLKDLEKQYEKYIKII